jgi:acetyltransferase-like isoleucine patch superfamily enzyme
MKPEFSRIADDVVFGKNVKVIGFANLYGCTIGDDSFIGPFVEIQSGVTVGEKVKIQSHAFICTGVRIAPEVFIGHGVMFTNDRFPRSTTAEGKIKGATDWECEETFVGRRAAIGSNATILCGVTIGENAVIGAGSVVTEDVPPRAVVAGNPAKVIRYMDKDA